MKRFNLMFFLLVALETGQKCNAAGVIWNSFVIDDFSSWVEGGWILGSLLPYAPGVGFLAMEMSGRKIATMPMTEETTFR